MSRSTVVIELAGDVEFSRDLAAGGVFVPGCTLQLTEECDLVVRGANHQISIPARVVYVDEHRGAGLELIGFSPEMKAQLAELEPVVHPELEFLDDPALDGAALDEPAPPDDGFAQGGLPEPIQLTELEALDDAGDDDLALTMSDGDGANADADAYATAATYAGDDDENADAEAYATAATYAGDDDANADPDAYGTPATYGTAATYAGDDDENANAYTGDADANTDLTNADTLPPKRVAERDDAQGAQGVSDPREPGQATGRAAGSLHERLRGLSLAAQVKMAVSGELHERIVLERMYGKNVWETLLRNPRLTAPEVSRIARYNSLPRVLLEIIVGNNAWLQIPEVRRALLCNPRLAADQIMKVLRLTPKHELKLATIQTAYPYAVRNAAKMVLRSE